MRILSADHILPITSEPLRDAAVAFDRSGISAIGARSEVIEMFPDAEIDDLGSAAIIPGLINCHSHLEITAMRGLLDDVEHDFPAWLLRLNDTRANRLTDEDIEVAALAGALEGAAAGVTCFGDIGRHGQAGMEALKRVGLRGVVFQETNFSPDERTAEKDFTALSELLTLMRNEETDLVQVGVSPHSPYTVSSGLFARIAEFAAAENMRVSIHAAESLQEDNLIRNGEGFFIGIYKKFDLEWHSPRCSPIEFLERTGIMRSAPLLAHCVCISDDDIERIVGNNASVAHCPKSNAKFGHGWAPFEIFLDRGIKVGFGSDSVASNNVCDILEEARFAVLGARNRAGSKRFIEAKEALETATMGGARALGLDRLVGSLEVGKKADITVIDFNEPAQFPVNDIYAAVIHSSNARDIRTTIVNGDEVFRDGRPVNFDTIDVLEELEEIGGRIKI
ncbi:MAG: amidohydrolase family protein [Pyrinomonadaceae bacterium]